MANVFSQFLYYVMSLVGRLSFRVEKEVATSGQKVAVVFACSISGQTAILV